MSVDPGQEPPTVRWIRRCFVSVALAAALLPLAARAQTTVFSTFGPGDSYLTGPCISDTASGCQGWLIGTNSPLVHQDLAQGFLYAGPTAARLSRLRLALLERSASTTGITVSFLHGADVGSATLLESWALAHTAGGSAPSIRSFDSFLEPILIVGDMYGIVASGDPSAGVDWRWNFSPAAPGAGSPPDSYFRHAPDPTWYVFNLGGRRDAWDVSVTEAGAVVPEPASLALVASGLLGVALIARRRRDA